METVQRILATVHLRTLFAAVPVCSGSEKGVGVLSQLNLLEARTSYCHDLCEKWGYVTFAEDSGALSLSPHPRRQENIAEGLPVDQFDQETVSNTKVKTATDARTG
eukprot:6189773-Pleurochrysis_carterae.AAC.4